MTLRQLLLRVILVALIAALCGGVAYALSSGQEKRYQATTVLLFSGTTPELAAVGYRPGDGEEDREVRNRIAEVEAYDVAVATAEALDGRWTPQQIAADVSAVNPAGSDTVRIQALAGSPQDAALLATQYRRQFLLREKRQVTARAEKAIEALEGALRELPVEGQRGSRGDALRAQIGVLEILARTGGEPVITEGTRAGSGPVEPQTTRNTLFGLLFGALLGIGLVLLRGATRTAPASA